MFCLGSKGSKNEKHFVNLGAEIANTCHESYRKTGNYTYSCSNLANFYDYNLVCESILVSFQIFYWDMMLLTFSRLPFL